MFLKHPNPITCRPPPKNRMINPPTFLPYVENRMITLNNNTTHQPKLPHRTCFFPSAWSIACTYRRNFFGEEFQFFVLNRRCWTLQHDFKRLQVANKVEGMIGVYFCKNGVLVKVCMNIHCKIYTIYVPINMRAKTKYEFHDHSPVYCSDFTDVKVRPRHRW